MTTNGKDQKPVGYGHDKQGAAGGDNIHAGKPGTTHTGPVESVEGTGKGPDRRLHP